MLVLASLLLWRWVLLMPRKCRVRLLYNFNSLAEMVDLLGSFHGPIDIREEMRQEARKVGMTLDKAVVEADLVIRIYE